MVQKLFEPSKFDCIWLPREVARQTLTRMAVFPFLFLMKTNTRVPTTHIANTDPITIPATAAVESSQSEWSPHGLKPLQLTLSSMQRSLEHLYS